MYSPNRWLFAEEWREKCPAMKAWWRKTLSSQRRAKAACGAASSQHCDGHAADFVAPAFGSPRKVCGELVARMTSLKFDQLICEGGWVHISFAPRPRNEVLTAHFAVDGRVSYTRGLA